VAGETPHVVVIAGPNGAGKTTAAPFLLRDTLGVTEFVNADTIAQGLSAFEPEQVAVTAGRVMLARLKGLAARRANFAFETTLASRSFAPWLAGLIAGGYAFHLIFLWLPSADFAVSRVAHRVAKGGHAVPEETVRRRYDAGLRNFFSLYQPQSTTWQMYDNSSGSPPRLIAAGGREMVP
jgi:predicted ABC-type ATPase